MGVTIATHNGSKVAREHNIRNEKVVAKLNHIDINGTYEIWHDEKIRVAYDRLFGESVRAYNENQAREDRKIESYFNTIKKDAKKHAAYEMIIAIGNRESMINENVGKEIMRGFVDGWKNRNPNLEMIGAYYHNDEEGVPHVHIDYIPVAHGYSRGMETQTGLVKAFKEMGIEKKGKATAQILWQKRENNVLEEMCRERGIEIEHPLEEGRKHLETEVYKKEKQLSRAIDNFNDLEEMNRKVEKKLEKKEYAVKRLKGELKEQKELRKEKTDKGFLGRNKSTVTLEYTEYRELSRMARERDESIKKVEKMKEEVEKVSKAVEFERSILRQRVKEVKIKEDKISPKYEKLCEMLNKTEEYIENEVEKRIEKAFEGQKTRREERLEEFLNKVTNGTGIKDFERSEKKIREQTIDRGRSR